MNAGLSACEKMHSSGLAPGALGFAATHVRPTLATALPKSHIEAG